MKIAALVTAATCLSTSTASPLDQRQRPGCSSDALAALGAANLEAYLAERGYPNPAKCNSNNTRVRREWSTLSSQERKNYINAVKCLASKPPKTPASIAAGVRNRYDDFVATHINQTLSIHGTGNFLSWHRYFTWAYEEILRNECGYTGTQPYYNWAYWAADPKQSPLFDGSDTSISGDGSHVPNRRPVCIPSPLSCDIKLPPAGGGGCVMAGPFQDWKVNLGPVSAALPNLPPNPSPNGLGYNPRCLRRDISKVAASWTRDSNITSLITQSPDFLSFSTTMQGDFAAGFLGVHTGGHFTIGGDPGGDLFASPGDPGFFFHHAMIDRVWWTWQNQDLEKRLYALGGTITLNNIPPSRNATMDDIVQLGHVGVPGVTIRDASWTLGGPFCYVYA